MALGNKGGAWGRGGVGGRGQVFPGWIDKYTSVLAKPLCENSDLPKGLIHPGILK